MKTAKGNKEEVQTMKVKGAKKNSRDMEDMAFNNVFRTARNYRNRTSFTDTISDMIEEAEVTRKVQASEDAPKFSGKFAFEQTFGQDESIKAEIEKELETCTNKKRKNNLWVQLRNVNNRIKIADRIRATEA